MPNHEQNYVVVSGDPAHVKRFFDEAFSDGDPDKHEPARVIDFEKIVPPPANIEKGHCGGRAVAGLHIETGEVCWYEWNRENWGTKWGAYEHQETEISGDEGTAELRLQFWTAWTAPTPIFHAIEQRWEVEVNAITIDEGGAPPQFYGDNVHDHLYINTNVEFS